MITIIDYGMGNLRSVQKGFERLGFTAKVTSDPEEVERASKLVLPGVGAFRDCMNNLRSGGFVEPIKRHIDSGRPFLGICLGLQLLFTESEEFGRHQGLGIIPGRVVRFPTDMRQGGEELKVPHMGWNQIEHGGNLRLFEGIPSGAHFYFVHSYYPELADATLATATCTYGVPFPAAVERGALFATQFHPEKSQRWGLRLLQNFAAIVRDHGR